ncbi:hypothetical protein NW752_009943 [Fusarium irregulare]|uniref:Uncharacterized protein n=1 Tax=Fusarium irregulare TaxID=2494466 RepID=A0A9W8PIX9_9HYPO|nr:hypothetical protein NW752_009943 [Fusarium irregulare]KAJ4008336.1 hypothetical protein NW766_009328 [Fusarium irregulare]
MSFESPSHNKVAANPDSHASNERRIISINASSPATEGPAVEPARSRLEGGGASSGLQTKTHVKGDEKRNSLPGTLNPYRDGRIRTPVPSKLKGKTSGSQGNFSVMQIHVQKPEMTARDLAAKRTSERTAAAARLASTQEYRHPKRSWQQSAIASPAPGPCAESHPRYSIYDPRSQLPSTIQSDCRLDSLPSAAATNKYQDKPSKGEGVIGADTVLNTNALHSRSPFAGSSDIRGKSTEHSRGPFAEEAIQEANVERTENSVVGDDSLQDIGLEESTESSTSGEPIQTPNPEHAGGLTDITEQVNGEQKREIAVVTHEPNKGDAARPAPASQSESHSESTSVSLSPSAVKAEQARILALFRDIQPRFIVGQLTKALVHFGTLSDVPSTDGSLFPQSASKNGPGDLLVSWLSEIFPAAPLLPHKQKGSSTGRPRGRPKGSLNSCKRKTAATKNTHTPLAGPLLKPHETTSTQNTGSKHNPNELPQATGTQSPGVLLPPVPAAQSLTADVAPTLPGQGDVPPRPIASISAQVVAIPSMRPIMPATAPIIQGLVPELTSGTERVPIPKLTPARRRPPTGRPRGRPRGSKTKARSLINPPGQRVIGAEHKAPQSVVRANDANRSTPVDLTSSLQPGSSDCDTRAPKQLNSGPTNTNEGTDVHTSQVVTSMARPDISNPSGGIDKERAEFDTEISSASQRLLTPEVSGNGGTQPTASKRKIISQQALQDGTTVSPQAPKLTVSPASSFSVQAQQTKRRCLSQESRQKTTLSPVATKSSVPGGDLSMRVQLAQSRPLQQMLKHQYQNWNTEISCQSQQHQTRQSPQLHYQSQHQQHPPDTRPVTGNQSSQASSPTPNRPYSQLVRTPDPSAISTVKPLLQIYSATPAPIANMGISASMANVGPSQQLNDQGS